MKATYRAYCRSVTGAGPEGIPCPGLNGTVIAVLSGSTYLLNIQGL